MADPGVILFFTLNTLALVCAGVACLPPARDIDVFSAALFICAIWAIAFTTQKMFREWEIVSAFYVLDVCAALFFYGIARKRKYDTPRTIRRRDWASAVAVLYAAMVVADIIHLAHRDDGVFNIAPAVVLVIISVVILVGVARGFGARALAPALLGGAAFFLFSKHMFLSTVHALSISIKIVVLIASWRSMWTNISAWTAWARTRSIGRKATGIPIFRLAVR